MICAPYRPHLHKSNMAAILQRITIAKEVIVAWSHIIHALYILWGWKVHYLCVFYISKVPWAAKCKIQDDHLFNSCEPWIGKYLLLIHGFYMFAGSWFNFWCVFYVLNAPWPSTCKIQDGRQLLLGFRGALAVSACGVLLNFFFFVHFHE